MDGARIDRTVLFADIAGSTRLYESVGDEAARGLLLACLDIVAAAVEAGGGRIHDRIGDELMCTFPEPDAAATAAMAMHTRVSAAHVEGKLAQPLRLRVGFVHGPILETTEGIFGTTVHAAARLSSLAKAGQILTTRDTLDALPAERRRRSRLFGNHVLKGMTGLQEIHELVWSISATTAHIPLRKAKVRTRGVELTYGGQRVRVDLSLPRVELGRDPACDLRVDGRAVSQLHARIVWVDGRIRLEDVSTNGTVVERKGVSPIRVHHEGTDLTGSGVLRLGMPDRDDLSALIEYHCDHTIDFQQDEAT